MIIVLSELSKRDADAEQDLGEVVVLPKGQKEIQTAEVVALL